MLVPMLVGACAETPRCVERGTPPRTVTVVECNAGKVAVCSTATYDPETGEGTYDPDTGALVKVPATVSGAQLTCDDYPNFPGTAPGSVRCRPSPSCPGAGQPAVCPNGAQPVCVLGREEALSRPAVDAGTSPDAGMHDDAGTGPTDAGSEDGGQADAGSSADAGDAG